MGQYHKVINLTKKEYINPRQLGDGQKLMEFGDSSSGTMTALAILLAASCKGGARGGGDIDSRNPLVGRWAGDVIAIVGDYAEDSDLPEKYEAHNLYEQCEMGIYRNISNEIAKIVEKATGVRFVGKGRKQKVDTR